MVLDSMTDNRHEFDQTPGNGEGQGRLECCSPWVTKSQTWLSDGTTTINVCGKYLFSLNIHKYLIN